MGIGRDESRRFEAERRWAQEELESDAQALDRRGQSLADIIRDAAIDGRVVSVSVAGRVFEGEAVHAAGDLLTLAIQAAEIDVRLTAADELRMKPSPATTETRVLARNPGSFLGRLNEVNALETEVEIGGRGITTTVPCRVAVVATDHVELDGSDGTRLVPIQAISFVVRRAAGPGRHRR